MYKRQVGRLDKETSGLLLFTDDGTLLHRLTHPRHHIEKTYIVHTARPIEDDTVQLFASGTLLLRSESDPLLPAQLERKAPCVAHLTLREGRYHQVRRMFAAVGNHVEALHRSRVGGLSLDDLPPGRWRPLQLPERSALYEQVGLSPPALP